MTTLTERQLREQEHFNKFAKAKAFSLDHFSKPEFGPWNPYWYEFDLVRREFRDSSQRILSFGCGRGAQAVRFAHLGYEVHGFDISHSNIALSTELAAQYNFSERTHFSVQPAEEVNYPDNFFDVVAGENVLHHIDIGKAIREVHRVLKPGGMAVFKEPWATPFRDSLRTAPPVSWVFPVGVKNLATGARYNHPPDTHKITPGDLAAIGQVFGKVEVVRFRVLAVFNAFARTRTFLEKCDYAMFRVLPFMRRFGDMVVIVVRK